MIMSWLWNSMVPKINSTCIFFTMVKEIQDAVNETYSKVHDVTQIFEIKMRISYTRQGDRFVTEYANILKSLCQKLDDYQCLKMMCNEDATLLKRFVEKERIFEFLVGLNVEYDQKRSQVLGRDELPSLNETISMIRVEKGRQRVMIES